MDQNEEYHDPDYPELPTVVKEEEPVVLEEDRIEKIKSIIRREFSNEVEVRENELMMIEQRISTSRRLLHRLRYSLVTNYYNDQKLQLSNSQIEDDVTQLDAKAKTQMTPLLRDGQRRIHPSVKKLLGQQTVDLDEIFLARTLRHKTRKDYSAMVQTRNYTIAAGTTKSLRPETKLDMESETSMEPVEPTMSKIKKVPRHLEPKTEKVVTIDDPTRNKVKHRYRFIIGNTSKYLPGCSRADRSTHKWLLYVRGPPPTADPSPALARLTARLHPSYAPHHTVRLSKAPFHISRRGWGEFPAKLELHFPLPEVNRPATVEHTIKLDRNYTGLQTLGAETIVDVWLYSTPEMLEYEYFDPIPNPITQSDDTLQPPNETQEEESIKPKSELIEHDTGGQTDSWLDFFRKDTTELDVDEMIIKPVKTEIVAEEHVQNALDTNVKNEIEDKSIVKEIDWSTNNFHNTELPNELSLPTSPRKRIMKYIDSATGKIYYLEMDRTLDLSKVQEIVINNSQTAKISPIKSNGLKSFRKKKSGGISLLKPEVKNQLKSDTSIVKDKPIVKNFSHIENDHCYLGNNWFIQPANKVLPDQKQGVASEIRKESSLFDDLCSSIRSFTCVRDAVYYLLKKISIITEMARDVDFVSNFPFVVENEEKYWKFDFTKRRNIEWSRAKLINRMLSDHFPKPEKIWRTKQILIFSRLYGFNPIRPDPVQKLPEVDEWSTWNDFETPMRFESIEGMDPSSTDICSLSVFNSEEFLNTSQVSIESLDSDEEVEVLQSDPPVKVKKEVVLEARDSELTVLPVDSEEDRLRFMFIEKKCADIGVELRNEDIGNGYSYSAVHAVLLSAAASLAEEVTRAARAALLRSHARARASPDHVWTGSRAVRLQCASVQHACAAGRLRALTAHALATHPKHDHQPL